MHREVNLMGALNRHATAADGYLRFQISRVHIEHALHLLETKPEVLQAILQDCLEARGDDKRKKS